MDEETLKCQFKSLLTIKLIEKLTHEKKPKYVINPLIKVGNSIPYYDLTGALKMGKIKTSIEDEKDITMELQSGEVVEYQVSKNSNAKYWLMYDISPITMDGIRLGIGNVDNSKYAPLVIT